ncbi:MAG: site-specific integrase [Spirochaetes bacterium]|nr:site-specific integrase [Spirochaetota bacterium]
MGKGKKPGDRPELLTIDEMNKLILSVASNYYFFTLYNTLKFTGRRIGEIYGTSRDKQLIGGVKVKDINFEDNTVTTQILKTKKRKLLVECMLCKNKISYKSSFCNNCGEKLPELDKSKIKYNVPEEKTIALKEDLVLILQNFIKQEQLKLNDYVFRKYSLVYLKKIIKKHVANVGINKNFSLHGFRHYFITQCKRAGMSNEDIAKWTGHKSPETMNIYDRRTSKDVENKINEVKL